MKNDPNREARLAEQLRKNLLRRKAQKKLQQQESPACTPEVPSPNETD
jgi:hypothetical protein